MSNRPLLNVLTRLPPASYDNGRPVSTWEALVLRNNLQHLINFSCQHRINWVGANLVSPEATFVNYYGYSEIDTGSAAIVSVWAQEFPITWIRDDFPVSLDIEIHALVGDAGTGSHLRIDARIVPASAPFYDLGTTALWSATAQSSGINTEAVIADLLTFDTALDQSGIFAGRAVTEESVLRSVQQAMLRLEIQVTIPTDEQGLLTEVLVREYAWHP